MIRTTGDDGREYFLNEDGSIDGWGMLLDPPFDLEDPQQFLRDLAATTAR